MAIITKQQRLEKVREELDDLIHEGYNIMRRSPLIDNLLSLHLVRIGEYVVWQRDVVDSLNKAKDLINYGELDRALDYLEYNRRVWRWAREILYSDVEKKRELIKEMNVYISRIDALAYNLWKEASREKEVRKLDDLHKLDLLYKLHYIFDDRMEKYANELARLFRLYFKISPRSIWEIYHAHEKMWDAIFSLTGPSEDIRKDILDSLDEAVKWVEKDIKIKASKELQELL